MTVIQLTPKREDKRKAFEKRMLDKAQEVINHVLDTQPSYEDIISILENVLRMSFIWRHLFRVKRGELELLRNSQKAGEVEEVLVEIGNEFRSGLTKPGMIEAINRLCELKDTLGEKSQVELEELIGVFIDNLS